MLSDIRYPQLVSRVAVKLEEGFKLLGFKVLVVVKTILLVEVS
jgi:hypothetical protein